jgi:uncharacterized protein (TIGR02270 family)
MRDEVEDRIQKPAAAVPIVPQVVRQHADDAVHLGSLRVGFVRAAGITPQALTRFDERLAAHLDGLCVAGESGWMFCETALEAPATGAVFTAAVSAVDGQRRDRFDWIMTKVPPTPESRRGLVAALGWHEREQLRGIVAKLLHANDPFARVVGIGACTVHGIDPGLENARFDPDSAVRARQLRAIGELGLVQLHPAGTEGFDEHPAVKFWSVWSEVMVGDRSRALVVLANIGTTTGPFRVSAFALALQAVTTRDAHAILQRLARDTSESRWVIHGSGIAGDPTYIPWLIGHMSQPESARLSGEAFSLITGADLDKLQLYRARPDDLESGPNDDPNDPNVAMDDDDGLPWPDKEKIEAWWTANGSRFQKGTRYFMGKPVTREHCIDVLKTGYQRQRILAAHYLCLLDPGTPLFNTSAPARRQQKLLAAM